MSTLQCNDIQMFLNFISVVMFLFSVIITVFMEDNDQWNPQGNSWLVGLGIINLIIATSYHWWFAVFMFAMVTSISIINVRIADGFIIQRVRNSLKKE